MERRPKRGVDGEWIETHEPRETCAPCLDADPQIRYRHFLTLAQGHTSHGHCDFDAVSLHLWAAMRSKTKLDVDDMRRYVEERLAWVKDQVTSYSGIVDDRTGALLPWWDARRQRLTALRDATDAQAQRAEDEREARGEPRRPAVPSVQAVDALDEAAHTGGGRWAHLHMEMFHKGVTSPDRYDEAAALCRSYAAAYPEDGPAWLAEAVWWEHGAEGTPSFHREPGEDDL